jgi:glycerol uptake facilitator protein
VPGKGSSDWSYAWIPVLGPLVGGAIGALIYVVAWPT